MLNAVFTTYLKRHLGLRKYAHNAAIHYYCKTWPLFNAIKFSAQDAIAKIKFPAESMHGHQLSFVNTNALMPYDPREDMDIVITEGERFENFLIQTTIKRAPRLNFTLGLNPVVNVFVAEVRRRENTYVILISNNVLIFQGAVTQNIQKL